LYAGYNQILHEFATVSGIIQGIASRFDANQLAKVTPFSLRHSQKRSEDESPGCRSRLAKDLISYRHLSE
jgi:hypothetical protein